MFETPMFAVHHQPEGRDWEHMKKALYLVEDKDTTLRAGWFTLSFIDINDIPVFAKEVISQLR
ncbi:hypothetical protein ACFL0D_05895 [Thermoproteota archaeon]